MPDKTQDQDKVQADAQAQAQADADAAEFAAWKKAKAESLPQQAPLKQNDYDETVKGGRYLNALGTAWLDAEGEVLEPVAAKD